MKNLLLWMIPLFTLLLSLLVLPTILCKLICANASIRRCLLSVFICLAILFTASGISKMLMPDPNMLVNLFFFMPLYVIGSASAIKKFMTIGIGRAIVLSVLVMICALLGSVIISLMVLRLFRAG
jgi:hypothetical protein